MIPQDSAAQLACISTFASILFTATLAIVASLFPSPRRQTPISHTLVSELLRETISNPPASVCKCSIPHIDACITLPRATQQITGSDGRSALQTCRGRRQSHALVSLPPGQLHR